MYIIGILVGLMMIASCGEGSDYRVATKLIKEANMAVAAGDYHSACGLLGLASHAIRQTGNQDLYEKTYKSEKVACQRASRG